MTEFELKQLEYLQFDRQQGLITLIQSQADLISNDMTMLSTFLFGYLVVAYFVGANLSKVQSIIFTTSFLIRGDYWIRLSRRTQLPAIRKRQYFDTDADSSFCGIRSDLKHKHASCFTLFHVEHQTSQD